MKVIASEWPKRRRRPPLAWKCLMYWLVVWSFPGFACPLALHNIPCAFSGLAARPICVRADAVLVSCFLLFALFSVFSILWIWTFQIFFRRPSVTVFLSSFFFHYLVIFPVIIILFSSICFPVQQTTNRIGNRVQCFFLFVNMVGARSVSTTTERKNTNSTEQYFTA